MDTVPILADWSGYGRHAHRPVPVPRQAPAPDPTTTVTATIASPTADLEAATAKLSLRLREQLAATGRTAPAGSGDLAGLVVSEPRESTDAYGRTLYWFRGTLQVGAVTRVQVGALAEAAWPVRPVPPRRGTGWERRLATAAAAADVRRDLAVHLDRASAAGHCSRDAGYDLLLAFEELTSNAFRHGTGAVDVTIAATEAGWLLVVSDEAPDRSPSPPTGRDRTLGGMGLEMVARLAREVGWQPGPGRKSVWAELPSSR
jgi:anti-sigma regulatory factor (Ser/Thr protein kinase)